MNCHPAVGSDASLRTIPSLSSGPEAPILDAVSSLTNPEEVGLGSMATASADAVNGRVCAIRMETSKAGTTPKPETLECARSVILFSTSPVDGFDADSGLRSYRL